MSIFALIDEKRTKRSCQIGGVCRSPSTCATQEDEKFSLEIKKIREIQFIEAILRVLHCTLKSVTHILCSQVLEVVGGRRGIDNRAMLAQSIFETSCRYPSSHKSYVALAS